METVSELEERCLAVARSRGVPKDQAQRFLESGYVPYPWQWSFHAAAREADKKGGATKIGLGGARGPGKSHAEFAQVALDDAQRCPNLKGLFLRQTGKAAQESFQDLVSRVLAHKVKYELTSNVLRFDNGSRILLGGFKDEKDIDKYIGIEYDVIAVEEGNQLTGEKKEKLRGSLRTSKPDWRPRWYESFNPGGIGHADVKETYVTPFREGLERDTRFIPSTYKDNPNLNDEYVDYLKGLKGQLGQAWRDGNFDILAGQYFSEWRYEIHVCDPFPIPNSWKRYCALDYGYTAPLSLGWYAIDEDGNIYRYRELYVTGHTGSQLGDKFVELTPSDEKITSIEADPSFWAKKGEDDNALSAAEKFQMRVKELLKDSPRSCPPLLRANNDRVNGWLEVHEWLRTVERDGKLGARLQVFSTCTEAIRTIPALVHDEHNPEDVNTNGEDHCGDEVRYAVMSRPRPAMNREEVGRLEFQRMLNRKKQGRERKNLFIS